MLPMHKPYSLLRNNKQSGPYSLEELLLLNLKPFDLIWVEGRSGGWSYPTEIDALKQHVAEAPKKGEHKDVQENYDDVFATKKEITPTHLNSPDEPARITKQATALPKKANNIYIKLPAGSKISEPSFSVITSMEESPEAKLERKAQALREKIQAFMENKNQPKADDELDTKYTRSLDDIKEEYSLWLHNQKKKKKFIAKKLLLIVPGIALLFVAGYFVMRQFRNEKVISKPITSVREIKATAFNIEEAKKNKTVTHQKEADKKATFHSLQKAKGHKTDIVLSTNYPASNVPAKIDGYIDSSIMAEEKQQPEETIISEPGLNQQVGARQKTTRERNESTAKRPIAQSEETPFAELIKLSESTGGEAPYLNLYNNSNKHINFVAIDVLYYKANKKLLQKKTLYFNNIAALSSSKLFVPTDKKAASMSYHMGLISTEDRLYYTKH